MMRPIFAAALACLFAVRLLTPAGFMPAFERGAVTIVACPDADGSVAPAVSHHHHGQSNKLHQPCPYAAAASLGLPVADFAALPALLVVGLTLLLGRAFLFVQRDRTRERPPLRGPPLPRLN
jgi:hypothetical protein